jgi:manganese transport system ATP-binding protein
VARGGRIVLGVDQLDVPAAAVTVLIGPNGSGKSTLLHVVAGLLAPAAGRVAVLGAAPVDSRRRVAYVLQAVAVTEHLPVTVREVVTMGRYAHRGALGRLRAVDRSAVDDALERLELGDLARRHIGELSGGQRQRALVAQALAQEAEVLLLDEPVTGLDLASVHRIRAVIGEERDAGRAVLVATHDLEDAARADHVVLLAGRVVAAGPPSAVLTRRAFAEAYAGRLLRLEGETLFLDEGAHHDHDHPGPHGDPAAREAHDQHASHP